MPEFIKKHLFSHKKGIIKYAAATILFVIPLYPKFPLLNIPKTYVSIRLEDFLILIISAIWLFCEYPRFKELLKDNLNISILIFIFVTFVSVLSGILLTQTVVPHIGFLHWIRRIEYFMVFFIGFSAARSSQNISFYIKCLFIVVSILFIFGLGQKYFNWPIITTQNYEYSKGVALRYTAGAHIPSTFAGHYDLATFLVLVTPVFFALFFTIKDNVKRMLILIPICFSYWLIVNAISRISIVSLLIGVSFALFLIRRYKEIPIVILVSVIVVLFSSNLIDRYSKIIEVIFNKTSNLIQSVNIYAAERAVPTPIPIIEDRSTSIRLNVEWPNAIRAFSKNPLLGTGFSSITLAVDNHYLRLLGEVGIIGFLAFLLIFLRITTILIKIVPLPGTIGIKDAYLAGIIGAIPGVLTNAVFIDVFEASKIALMFWLLIGFAVSLARNYQK